MLDGILTGIIVHMTAQHPLVHSGGPPWQNPPVHLCPECHQPCTCNGDTVAELRALAALQDDCVHILTPECVGEIDEDIG